MPLKDGRRGAGVGRPRERPQAPRYRTCGGIFGAGDPAMRRVLEVILALQEEHADDLADLLVTLDPKKPVR